MEKLNYDTIKTYQSFKSVEDMDQAVRGFLYRFKSTLSDGAVKVLNFIWRYSVKVVGVSFAKYETIAEAIGISRRTVIRAVKTLEDLGFITKIPTVRMNGKQGVNLCVIQPFEKIDSFLQPVSPQDVTAIVTPNKAESKQSSLCENKQSRIIEKKQRQPLCHPVTSNETIVTKEDLSQNIHTQSNSNEKEDQNLSLSQEIDQQVQVTFKPNYEKNFDSSFLPNYVNKDFIQAAQPYFHTNDIYKLWAKIHLAHKKVSLMASLEDIMERILTDFKKVIFMYKMGKIKSTFEGYFYQVIYGTLWNLKKEEYKNHWYEQVMKG
ncbi:helix-turn-helix domain-containing protein [Niallia sp. Krafla_26]|uniref:helix-turn-helix domain-containing protein n=1 Tax=Niallia sp. Krafla_26 TaxID=3064703 RepID=UPI003D1735E7